MAEEEDRTAAEDVHDALAGYLDEGEIVVSWMVVVDVAGPDGTRYLAHRAGGGHDGTDPPMAWTALGMLQTSMALAQRQVVDLSDPPFEDPPSEDDEDQGSE